MKYSGGEAEGNADDVLDLVARDVEVGRDLREAVAGPEAIDQVLDAGAAMHHEWLAERLGGIDRDLSRACRRAGACVVPSRRRRR